MGRQIEALQIALSSKQSPSDCKDLRRSDRIVAVLLKSLRCCSRLTQLVGIRVKRRILSTWHVMCVILAAQSFEQARERAERKRKGCKL